MRINDKKKLASFLSRSGVAPKKTEIRAQLAQEHDRQQACATDEVAKRARAEFQLGPNAPFEIRLRGDYIVARPADSGQKYRRIGSVADLASNVKACAREKEK